VLAATIAAQYTCSHSGFDAAARKSRFKSSAVKARPTVRPRTKGAPAHDSKSQQVSPSTAPARSGYASVERAFWLCHCQVCDPEATVIRDEPGQDCRRARGERPSVSGDGPTSVVTGLRGSLPPCASTGSSTRQTPVRPYRVGGKSQGRGPTQGSSEGSSSSWVAGPRRRHLSVPITWGPRSGGTVTGAGQLPL